MFLFVLRGLYQDMLVLKIFLLEQNRFFFLFDSLQQYDKQVEVEKLKDKKIVVILSVEHSIDFMQHNPLQLNSWCANSLKLGGNSFKLLIIIKYTIRDCNWVKDKSYWNWSSSELTAIGEEKKKIKKEYLKRI